MRPTMASIDCLPVEYRNKSRDSIQCSLWALILNCPGIPWKGVRGGGDESIEINFYESVISRSNREVFGK